MTKTDEKPLFLSAEWRKLLMANYVVDPKYLDLFVPPGTELDYWDGKCYVSLIGFMFLDSKLKGFSIPLHQNFEEINLRFYVKRKVGSEWRRGVVFIKEIVPKPAIAWVANIFYKENYVTRQMRHQWKMDEASHEVSYGWKPFLGGEWTEMKAVHAPEKTIIELGSEAEFITEHYWGYAKRSPTESVEYEVRHPRWSMHEVTDFSINGSLSREYGQVFSKVLSNAPSSVFLADGSAIEIMQGSSICVE